MRRTDRLTLFVLAGLSGLSSLCGAAQPRGSLFLTNGDHLAGEWRDDKSTGHVTWQPTFTNEPYEFPWSKVAYALFPQPLETIVPIGAYRIDMVGGDMFIGDLVEVTPESVTVAVTIAPQQSEHIKVSRRSINGVTQIAGPGGPVYMGPDALSEWQIAAPDNWRYAQGALATSIPGAVACRGVKLYEKVLIEVELSWKDKADFSLELGVSKARQQAITKRITADESIDDFAARIDLDLERRAGQRKRQREDPEATSAFRLETISDYLVVVRETAEATSLATLQKQKTGAGRVSLLLYLDQRQNRLIVATPNGTQLADLHVECTNTPFESGVLLNNRLGDIQLDKLYVSEWNGESPSVTRAGQSIVTLTDGEVVYGEVVGYEAEEKKLLIAKEEVNEGVRDHRPNPEDSDDGGVKQPEKLFEVGSEETLAQDKDPSRTELPTEMTPVEIDVNRVANIRFPSIDNSTDASPRLPNHVTVVMHSGQRVTGVAERVSKLELNLVGAGLENVLSLPFSAIRSVQTSAKSEAIATKPVFPRLTVEGTRLSGELTSTEGTAANACLLWRPAGSRNSAALRNDVGGQINFREAAKPKTSPPKLTRRPAQNNNLFGMLGSIFSSGASATPARTANAQPAVMFLRLGDKVPCTIESIDSHGVCFSSPFSSSKVAGHEHVKAIELVTQGVDGRVTSDRREQLLTLPRMRSQNPPTHLLVSTKGDYLRCRLLKLTDKYADVEIGLEESRIDRSYIARIIWLDPPAGAEEKAAPADPDRVAEKGPESGLLRVQAVRRDGVRLTFRLEAFESSPQEDSQDSLQEAPADIGLKEEPHLVGVSPVLMTCRVMLREIDVLLLGDRIEQAAAELSYQQWKMRHAIVPRDTADGEHGDASTGFPLVGKPAPELRLPFFAQNDIPRKNTFNPSDYKGDVLILDFWASWCGPCMQAMPTLHGLGEEYADRGVHVVAVNLQDSPDEITAALRRLGIEPTVALDSDGVAAQRYQVTGIPQTVLVDRKGLVANVFVGASDKYEESLRTAIDAALADSDNVP